jgi:hypothetical protein
VARNTCTTIVTTLAAMLIALPALGASMPTEGDNPGEGAPAAARISYLDGTAYCWGPFDDGKRELTLNDLVREGDQLYAAPGTFVEVEFPGSSYLRLDAGSSVTIRTYAENLEFAPEAGAFYVSTGDWAEAIGPFGNGDGVEVASASLVRVDMSPDGYREMGVVYGLGRVLTDHSSIEVADGQAVWADEHGGDWASGDFDPYDGSEFDEWSMEREDRLRGVADEDSPSYPLVGYQELDDHGNWVVVDGVWCWRPFYVETDWRPFSTGEWIWYADYGWVWVSSYGWGYTTSHHGRWHYDPFYGWVWMPGMVWSPAWVTWSLFDGYVGWCAVGWWGRPVVWAGYYSYWDYRCWTMHHYDYFWHGGYHHHGPYSYHDYHHHNGHSYPRPSGSHHHNDGNASGSHHRPAAGDHGDSHRGGGDASASNSRGSLAGDRGEAAHISGSNFRTFDRAGFEKMQRSPLRDANTEIMRGSTASPTDRAAFERGGEERTGVIQRNHDFGRDDRFGGRDVQGRGGARGTQERGSAGQGHDGGGGERATMRPDGQGSLSTVRPSERGDLGRGGEAGEADRRARESLGDGQRESTGDRAPAVPRYSGRSSEGQRHFDPPRDTGERGSQEQYRGSSGSSGQSGSRATSGSRSSTQRRSSSDRSSSRSRSSSSSNDSDSKKSSSSSDNNNSGGKKRRSK